MARIVVACAIVAAIVVPWLVLVQRRESQFLADSIGHNVFRRILQPLEGHSGPPGYHLALIFATFLPWSLLLPMAVILGWRHRDEPRVGFALAAVLGPWVMFELVVTKLPHYMLPAFPPLAYLAADAVVRGLWRQVPDLYRRRTLAVGAAAVGVALLALGIGAIGLAQRFQNPLLPPTILTIAAGGFTALTVALFLCSRPGQALLGVGAGMGVIYVTLFTIYLPRADVLRVSPRAADVPGARDGFARMLDYKEPSLAFYRGGHVRESSSMRLSHRLLDGEATTWFITENVWEKTPPDVRARLTILGSVRGIAYADGGRDVTVMVVRETAP